MVLNWPEMPLKVPTLRTRGPGAAREGVPDAVPITRTAAVKTSKLLQRISSVSLLVVSAYRRWVIPLLVSLDTC